MSKQMLPHTLADRPTPTPDHPIVIVNQQPVPIEMSEQESMELTQSGAHISAAVGAITIDQILTADTNDPKTSFKVGETILYIVWGSVSTPRVLGIWKISTPCGSSTLWNQIIDVPIKGYGAWAVKTKVSCPGTHKFTFSSGSSSRTVSYIVTDDDPRDAILARARQWVKEKVPYSKKVGPSGYRQDCSGYVSFAWSGPKPGFTTSGWKTNANKIPFDDLQPGDALNSPNGGHMILFKEWVDKSAGKFNAYEEDSFSGAHESKNITFDRSSGTMSRPNGRLGGYHYPGTYFPIRKKGL